MRQYQLKSNELILKVKRAPLLIRTIMFLVTFLFFIGPVSGIILSIEQGKGPHLMYFIGTGIFAILGFYMLRVSLWNTYGFEKIIFSNDNIIYEANYGLFKDGKKTKKISPLVFSIVPAGYEEDNKGILRIGSGDTSIDCVTKMPNNEIEELIEALKK